LAEATGTTTQAQRPIVPYLVLPEDPNETPYLLGSRCRACGAVYLGERRFCSKCSAVEQMETIRLSDEGEVYVWTIVHQSAPGIPVPYIAAIVDLPEGVSVRCNIEGVEPKPENMKFGMKVKMFTEKVREDKDGNAIIAYKFRPIG
jgi:uncharacterized OB-fold protein